MLFALSCVVVGFFYFLGLGSCLLWIWRTRWQLWQDPSSARRVHATLLTSGLALHHALTLALPSFSMAWALGAVLSGVGWWSSSYTGMSLRWRLWPYSPRASAALVLLLVYFTRYCVSGPIDDWDSRSIWFFHAKILHHFQSVQIPQVWTDPTIDFSHTPYPKLLPALAALCAGLAGGWNDTFPRLAFALLGLPAFFSIASLRDRFWPLAWLWYALVISQYSVLSFGYADGFHALYAGLALLFFTRAIHEPNELDAWQGTAFLALALQIKNEGLLVAAVLGVCLGALLLKSRRPFYSRPLIVSAFALFSGWALWTLMVQVWGVREPMPLGGGDFLSRVASRVTSGVPVLLTRFFITQKLLVFALITAAAAWTGRARGSRPLAWGLLLGAPALFTLVLSLVYLGTPHEFNWHIGTSIKRTSLTVRAFLVVATYFAFSRGGVASEAAQPETDRAR